MIICVLCIGTVLRHFLVLCSLCLFVPLMDFLLVLWELVIGQ